MRSAFFLLKVCDIIHLFLFATLAQLVERHFRKVEVLGSIPRGGSREELCYNLLMASPDEIKKQIAALEKEMQLPGFWEDKRVAQETLAQYNQLKADLAGEGKYDGGNAII